MGIPLTCGGYINADDFEGFCLYLISLWLKALKLLQMMFLDLVVVCPVRVLNKQCLISKGIAPSEVMTGGYGSEYNNKVLLCTLH